MPRSRARATPVGSAEYVIMATANTAATGVRYCATRTPPSASSVSLPASNPSTTRNIRGRPSASTTDARVRTNAATA